MWTMWKKKTESTPPKTKKKALALAKAIQKLDHVTVSPLLPTGKKPVKTGAMSRVMSLSLPQKKKKKKNRSAP